jgi:hypothetical protein
MEPDPISSSEPRLSSSRQAIALEGVGDTLLVGFAAVEATYELSVAGKTIFSKSIEHIASSRPSNTSK